MGQAFLTRIEIDGRDALTGFQKRDGNVDRGRRLARTPFFVADNDNVSRLTGIGIRLDQHYASPAVIILNFGGQLVKRSQPDRQFMMNRVAARQRL
jgi:hypothetical protein